MTLLRGEFGGVGWVRGPQPAPPGASLATELCLAPIKVPNA